MAKTPDLDLQGMRKRIEEMNQKLASLLADYSNKVVASSANAQIKEAALHLSDSVLISVYADICISTGTISLRHSVTAGTSSPQQVFKLQ